MRIASVIDISLVDVPGIPVTVLFTGGCNYDCSYCQNAELIPLGSGEELDIDELVSRVLDTLSEGFCVTGGEPTLHSDLPKLLRALKSIGKQHINLNTNGSVPAVLRKAIPFLDSVWLDVKTCPSRYQEICRCKSDPWPRVNESIQLIIESGVQLWPRTTIVGGIMTTEDITCIMNTLHELKFKGQYLLQDYVDSLGVREDERDALKTPDLSEYEHLVDLAPEGIELTFQWRQQKY